MPETSTAWPEVAADEKGDDDEGEPSEDGLLAVLRGPASGASREVGARHLVVLPA
jgi:hypothetical protein